MMWGGRDGLEAGMRALSVANITLLTWNKKWTHGDVGSLNLAADGFNYF